MDDLLHKFNEVILQTISAESRLEDEFKKSIIKLDEHVTQTIAAGTPIQTKKRPKRLHSTEDGGLGDQAAGESSTSSGRSSCAPRTSHRKNSTQDNSRAKVRSLVEEMAAVAHPNPPLPVVEEHNQELQKTQNEERRPARSARVKACQNLKEPSLGTKMRQPSITIKKERISLEIEKELKRRAEPMELDLENDGNLMNSVVQQKEKTKDVEKRKSNNDEGFGSTNEKEKESDEPSSREISVIIIPKPIAKVEVFSDDEDAEKMPPPMLPPPLQAPKTKVRSKKADKSKVKGSDVFPVAIKLEKDAAERSSTSAVSSAESTISNSSTRSSTRNRKKKTSTQSETRAKMHIKTEKLSTDGKKSANRTKTFETPTTNSPTHSEKSVYEDALDGDTVMRPIAIALNTMPMIVDGEKNQTYAIDKNGTFSVQASNGTFVMPSPTNGTFNMKSPETVANATFDVRQLPGPGNNTFVLEKPKSFEEQQRTVNNASIMTEDNSHIEESPEKPPPKVQKPVVAKKPQTVKGSKKQNELFSLQSPVKTRIEAFEKAAVGSPFNVRIGASKNTTPSQQARFPSKTSTTPLASQRFQTSAKASTTQTTPTAQSGFSLSKGISSSASKLAHLQKKPTLASANLPKSQSLSREPSVERVGTLSAASSSSSLALDEKKKKREEKQRLAQQQREQIEKEKRENAERLMKEKEEKHRKLVQEKEDKLRAEQVKKAKKMEEFEKRRHLEELNQRMLADQKREELSKLEQQHRLEREQAELFKINQTKENYEIKLHKQMYQQKLQQQQKMQQAHVLQQQQQLQLKKGKPNAAPEKSYFTFDMIQTDDSTDDESASSHKKTKRPPFPAWCSKEDRNQTIRIQREINLNVIDLFFSVAPMTPDLREIFPSIDARKLKRNSSAVWRTPPRYSQMPKY